MKICNEKGYILASTLMISLVVTSLMFSIFLVVFLNNYVTQKKIGKKKVDLANMSGLQQMISNPDELSEGLTEFEIDSIEVLSNINLRGLFYEIEVFTTKNGDSSRCQYLIANNTNDHLNNAFTISRPDFRGVVAGKTGIKGNMQTTNDRITFGSIPGITGGNNNYLQGDLLTNEDIPQKLVNEETFTSVFNLKEIDNSQVINVNGPINLDRSYISELRSNVLNISGDLIVSDTLLTSASFEDLFVSVSGSVLFEESTVSKINLSIVSDGRAEINTGCKVENILLSTTDTIKINPNSQFFNCQLYSKKSILIDNCLFEYPSTIGLYVDCSEESNFRNTIDLQSTVVNGTIMLVSSVTGLSGNKSKILIDKGSRIQGFVYSENNLELYGPVYGSLYTYNVLYHKKPTDYINWLVDLEIDRKKLDENFLIPVCFNVSRDYEILDRKWIR